MNYAVILAGGTGSRAGGALPKQFKIVRGKRMIWWSVDAFKAFDPSCRIVMAIHKDFLDRWEEEYGKEEKVLGYEITKVEGGSTRFHSVKNALERIVSDHTRDEKSPLIEDCKVFIHDGARPLVTKEVIARGAHEARRGAGGIPVVPIVDSIRKIEGDESFAVDRKNYVAVQTPQVFMLDDIIMAYRAAEGSEVFTDDASVAERYGLKIIPYPGDTRNIKITNPEDFKKI